MQPPHGRAVVTSPGRRRIAQHRACLRRNHLPGRLPLALLVVLAAGACSMPSIPFLSRPTPTVQPTSTPRATPTQTPSPMPSPTPTTTPSPTASPEYLAAALSAQAQALLPAFSADVQALQSSPLYELDIRVAFEPGTTEAQIEGTATVQFTNPSARELSELVFMLWPNGGQSLAEMGVSSAEVGGMRVMPQVEHDGLLLRLPLPQALQPGERISVRISFTAHVWGPMLESHPHRSGVSEGVLVASAFYPTLARLADGTWQMREPAAWGDSADPDVAFFDAHITTSARLALAASGLQRAQTDNPNGTQTQRILSGPVREFTFALGPFAVSERMQGDVLLRAWMLPGHAAEAESLLKAAGRQVHLLSDLLGPYPYTELDLVDAPQALEGSACSGLALLGTVGTLKLTEPAVHQVAHQWFCGLIGNDPLQQPWLDEAAATFAEALYLEEYFGEARATGMLGDFRSELRFSAYPALPIGLSSPSYPSAYAYQLLVQRKGALFFDALRREMGAPAFSQFMQTYFTQFRYGQATADGFKTLAEQACGCDLTVLFNLWVFEGGTIPGL
jgi:hypothetical protein